MANTHTALVDQASLIRTKPQYHPMSAIEIGSIGDVHSPDSRVFGLPIYGYTNNDTAVTNRPQKEQKQEIIGIQYDSDQMFLYYGAIGLQAIVFEIRNTGSDDLDWVISGSMTGLEFDDATLGLNGTVTAGTTRLVYIANPAPELYYLLSITASDTYCINCNGGR